jgi:hypothetical protein
MPSVKSARRQLYVMPYKFQFTPPLVSYTLCRTSSSSLCPSSVIRYAVQVPVQSAPRQLYVMPYKFQFNLPLVSYTLCRTSSSSLCPSSVIRYAVQVPVQSAPRQLYVMPYKFQFNLPVVSYTLFRINSRVLCSPEVLCSEYRKRAQNCACAVLSVEGRHYFVSCVGLTGPPRWSSGQSSWLLTQRSRVRFPALPDFLSSIGSGTGSTQPL